MKNNRLRIAAALIAALVPLTAPAQDDTPPNPPVEEKKQDDLDSAYADVERSIAIRQLDRALAQAKQTNALLDEVKSKGNALEERLKGLRTNEEGKRLASAMDEGDARRLQRLMDFPPVTSDFTRAIEQQLQGATESLQKLRASPPTGFVPSDAQQDELVTIGRTLANALASVKQNATWIDQAIGAAPKDLDLSKAPTLEAVMAEFQQRQYKNWKAAQQLGIELAQPESREQITANARTAELERALEHAKELLQESRAEVERNRIESEMRIAIVREQSLQREQAVRARLSDLQSKRLIKDAQIDVSTSNASAAAELIRKRQECKDPEMLAAIRPLTTPGFTQPGSREVARERGPVSLRALAGSGALEPTREGLAALYSAGYNPREKERPTWFRIASGFNGIYASPAKRAHLIKIQEYLIKYGKALQVEGYLAE